MEQLYIFLPFAVFFVAVFGSLALLTLLYDGLCNFFSSPSKRKERDFFREKYHINLN